MVARGNIRRAILFSRGLSRARHPDLPRRQSRTLSTATPPMKLIIFIRVWPAPAILPAEQLMSASAMVLSDPSVFVPALQYGPETGYQPLREELATYLSDFFGVSWVFVRFCFSGGVCLCVVCFLLFFLV